MNHDRHALYRTARSRCKLDRDLQLLTALELDRSGRGGQFERRTVRTQAKPRDCHRYFTKVFDGYIALGSGLNFDVPEIEWPFADDRNLL